MLVALPVEQIAYWCFVAATCFPAVAFFLCALVSLRRENEPGGRGEVAVSRQAKKAGYEILDDFYVTRSDGGIAQIDHAIKLPGGIAVVETKDWQGSFYYPADRLNGTWMDLSGEEPIPAFDGANPFGQNEGHCDAVREAVGEAVPVWNVVVMTNPACGFSENPDDEGYRPPALDRLMKAGESPLLPYDDWPVAWEIEDLDTRLRELGARRADGIEEAWNTLKRAARRDSATRRKHRDLVGAEPSGRGRAVATLVVAAIASGAASSLFWAFQWGFIG